MYGDYYGFRPYVSVAQRRARAERKLKQLAKKGYVPEPIKLAGRKIATTFWGKSWCDHLESFSDYENRLPRGRSYVRNGSVVDLKIEAGKITAMVAGSELYRVAITIDPLASKLWKEVQSRCAGRIGSLIELLQGKLSNDVMQVVAHREQGLFPLPREIALKCSCPDWAEMCKHVAATLYGVGARLDEQPDLLFKLRKVNHHDLIAGATELARPTKRSPHGKRSTLAAGSLSDVFGIEIDSSNDAPPANHPAGTNANPDAPAKAVGLRKSKAPTQKATRKAAKQSVETAASSVAVVEHPEKMPKRPKSKALLAGAKRSNKMPAPPQKLQRPIRPK